MMKLDLSALSKPIPSLQPVKKLRGQPGTLGTPVFMPTPASLLTGDKAGTTDNSNRACPQIPLAYPQHQIVQNASNNKASPLSPIFPASFDREKDWGASKQEMFEERAAIMEFEGGFNRLEAEAAAQAITYTNWINTGMPNDFVFSEVKYV